MILSSIAEFMTYLVQKLIEGAKLILHPVTLFVVTQLSKFEGIYHDTLHLPSTKVKLFCTCIDKIGSATDINDFFLDLFFQSA